MNTADTCIQYENSVLPVEESEPHTDTCERRSMAFDPLYASKTCNSKNGRTIPVRFLSPARIVKCESIPASPNMAR